MNTSNEALKSIKAVIPSKQRAIYKYIASREDGSTCDEVEVALGLSHQTASARINEMYRWIMINPSGTRKTRSGRNATIWKKACSA